MTDHVPNANAPIPRERTDDWARRAREDLAMLTFAHDYGFDGVKLAIEALGNNAFFAAVANQRAEMRLDGRMTMDETGNEHRSEKLDLEKLGLNAAQISEILAAAEAEKALAEKPASFTMQAPGTIGGATVNLPDTQAAVRGIATPTGSHADRAAASKGSGFSVSLGGTGSPRSGGSQEI